MDDDTTTTSDPFAETVPEDELEEEMTELSGYNPSEEEEPATPDPLTGSLEGEDATPVETSAEPQEEWSPGAFEAPVDDPTLPPVGTSADPVDAEPEKPKTPKRERDYIILEQLPEKDGGFSYRPIRAETGRDTDTALRKAYKAIAEERGDLPDLTLVAVAERMWRPQTVTARPSTRLAIDLA